MSLTTKKIFLTIVSAMLALCVSFAVVSLFNNGSKPAYAQEQSKEVVEWTAGTGVATSLPTVESKNLFESKDGTLYEESFYTEKGLNKYTANSPLNKIIKKDVVFTALDESNSGGKTGVVVSAAWPNSGVSSYEWQLGPRVHMFASYIMVGNGWSYDDSEMTKYYLKNNPYAEGVDYSNTEDRYKLEQGVPYSIYYGLDIQFDENDALSTFDIYLKITSFDGTQTYIDTTFEGISATPKLAAKVTKENSTDIAYYIFTTAKISTSESNAKPKYREYAVSKIDGKLDALEKDADISAYWLINYVDDNRVGKFADAASGACTTLTKDKQFYTPDFDNRWTFKLSVNNEWNYFSTEKFHSKSGTAYNAGAIRIGLGQRYSDYGFKIDYYRDKITLSCAKSTLGSTTVSFDLDYTKEYKTSIVVRDIRDDEGNLKYRLQVLDMVEIGNEEHKITVMNLTDFLVKYGNSDGDYLPKHMRLTNGEDHNSLSTSDLCSTSEGCEFYLTSLEPQKYVYINSATAHVLNSAKIELPQAEGIIGYICENDGKLYKAGIADLSACVDAHIKFQAVTLPAMPTVLNVTDMRLVDVQLRFKLEVAKETYALLAEFGELNFVVKSGDEVVECTPNVLEKEDSYVMTLTTGVLAESDYAKQFVATATFTVDYANGAETINLPGSCTSSAAHCANYVKNNPTEFGVEAWNEAYIAEFDRIILAGGAQ